MNRYTIIAEISLRFYSSYLRDISIILSNVKQIYVSNHGRVSIGNWIHVSAVSLRTSFLHLFVVNETLVFAHAYVRV